MDRHNFGGCLCGELREVIGCHCSQCRRQTGLYYAATDVPLEQFQMLEQATLAWYRASDSARRGFCSTCGSALFWQAEGSDKISILAGA